MELKSHINLVAGHDARRPFMVAVETQPLSTIGRLTHNATQAGVEFTALCKRVH